MATHFYFNGHTYEIETSKQTWDSAVTNATSLAWSDDAALGVSVTSYLVNIGSSAENAAILKNLKASMVKGGSLAQDGGGADYAWIGASDSGAEGTWLWTDATSVSYSNWGSGSLGSEPDNFGGSQNYAAMGAGKWPASGGGLGAAGQWNDLSGSNLLWSIIEWDGLIGTTSADNLVGTSGDDVIDGNAGNDSIKSGEGNDVIYAGDGNDKINAGNGNNYVIAETGKIDSDDGDDRIDAGAGNDVIGSGTGNDVVKAGDGNNIVYGGSGDDVITTGSGNDIINKDGYYIEDGMASSGSDTIKSGAGDDVIWLGDGNDKVWGGKGNDVFVFNFLPEETEVVMSGDQYGTVKATYLSHKINDFDAGSDNGVIDILSFDSAVYTSLIGLKETSFIKGKGLTGASQNETGIDDYLIYDTSSGRLYYDADGNQSDSEAVLVAVVKGRVADFGYEDFEIWSSV
ncbi:lectin-like protein [Quatrionicoccus australiensis]|uniref:lectin-like protein n=1 Tax=Quatrionicoccus australiensis TaxID=138118 RepID=UPI001CF83757|nr:lectin-like protein [Quatrionicoccus australiensis]UCV14074.1 hypothetical protein KI612_14130 [Quatrionicoccus australiensis]